MIDLDAKSLTLIKQIFNSHLPRIEVKAFGSRVTGKAQPFSDLDLVVLGKQTIPTEKMNELRFALSNSDLPIMVDVVDWHLISDAFKEKIQQDWIEFIELP